MKCILVRTGQSQPTTYMTINPTYTCRVLDLLHKSGIMPSCIHVTIYHNARRASVAGIAARLLTSKSRNCGSIPGVGKRFCSYPKCPDPSWGPFSLLYNTQREPFPAGKAAGAWIWPLTYTRAEVKHEWRYSRACTRGVQMGNSTFSLLSLRPSFKHFSMRWLWGDTQSFRTLCRILSVVVLSSQQIIFNTQSSRPLT